MSGSVFPVLIFAAFLTGWIFSRHFPAELESINLPPEFQISVYAEDVPGARSLSLSPEGILFVGSRGEGKVYAVIDRDNNKKSDAVVTIASGLHSPNGVVFYQGDLYVAEISRVLKFKDIVNNLGNPPDFEVVNDSFPGDEWHGWKYIKFGPDNRLYVPVGAPCNICNPGDERYASIMRMNPDGSGLEIFARGIRNTVGFDWHPVTGHLWFTDNGRDRMGDNIPPDELNLAEKPGLHPSSPRQGGAMPDSASTVAKTDEPGEVPHESSGTETGHTNVPSRASGVGLHFGFPFCHGEDIPDPEFAGQGGKCHDYRRPARALGPHVAALGMIFYTGDMFPKGYKHQIFIAEHGSWNRTIPIGYRIMLARLEGDKVLSYEVFADGWLNGPRAWGRPVDIVQMQDGSLLVSDDKQGMIYRISYGP